MRNKRSVIAAGLALFAVIVGAQLGHAQQVSTALASKAPEAATISETADLKGYVPIIVEFASPIPPSAMRPDPAVLEPLKAQIAATQNAIIATHFGSAANPRPGQGFDRALRLLDITPMMSLNVNKAELDQLAADPRVLRVHLNRLSRANLIDSVPLIGMTGVSGAYALGATGANQAVAIVDTGVQSNHEFLTGKVILEACFSNGGGGANRVSLCPGGANSQTGAGAADSETAQCINGSTELCVHGTHVAGIAAGNNTNQQAGEPPNGVAKDAKIVAVQIFTRFNSDADCGAGLSPCALSWSNDQMAALNWLFQNALTPAAGVSLASANMSLGSGLFSGTCDLDPLKPSIDNLLNAGVATAIAAGNNSSVSQISAPGCISTAITVGSTTKLNAVSSFSNMSSVVDLLAPGSSIQSSVAVVPHSTTTYQFFNGTSMATPHVAGAFAALRTLAPSATVAQILSALQSTGISITDTRSGGTITKPRIRVDLAAQALISNSPVLLISPASNIATSGGQGGPFSPSSFQFQLSTNTGSVNYSISGVPSWLTASSTSGTATTSATAVTFTVNGTANSLAIGTYGPTTITFTNTTNGQGTDTRTATLTVTLPPPVNDNFANATTIQAGQTVVGTNVNATFEQNETSHNVQFTDPGGASVWWRFVAPASGTYSINTCGSNFDTVLAVYTGNAVNALSVVAGNDDASTGTPCAGTNQSATNFSAVAGTVYSIVVDGFNNNGGGAATGNIQLALSAGPSQALVVTPLTDIAASGNQGGPFSPASFQYQLNASTGSVNYSITGVPAWLNASSTSGTVTTAPTTVTFSVNATANGLAFGTFNATISFANTTNGQGNQTRGAQLTVNSSSGGSPIASSKRRRRI